jgi:hypothetical protein
LKPEYDLDLQVISGFTKRNAAAFKQNIFEGSQCNAAYKLFSFGSKSRPEEESKVDPKQLTKVLLFEDVDTVFHDEVDFYPQLVKLLSMTKVPVLMTASSASYIETHLAPLLR